MDIILLERIENLGQMGDLVTVKPGYARNYLLPQGKALRATAENKARFETERAQLEADNLARKSEAEAIAKKMEGLSITLIRAASEMGQLYGSASSRDIANAVSEAGFTISRNQVDLNTAMKTLGFSTCASICTPRLLLKSRSTSPAVKTKLLNSCVLAALSAISPNVNVRKLPKLPALPLTESLLRKLRKKTPPMLRL